VRAQTEPKFRKALWREAVESYLNGDLETGKAVLRDYVNATLGFQALEKQTDIPPIASGYEVNRTFCDSRLPIEFISFIVKAEVAPASNLVHNNFKIT